MPTKKVPIHYRRYLRGTDPAIAQPLAVAVTSALDFTIGGVPLDEDPRLRTCEDEDYGSIILEIRELGRPNDVHL